MHCSASFCYRANDWPTTHGYYVPLYGITRKKLSPLLNVWFIISYNYRRNKVLPFILKQVNKLIDAFYILPIITNRKNTMTRLGTLVVLIFKFSTTLLDYFPKSTTSPGRGSMSLITKRNIIGGRKQLC